MLIRTKRGSRMRKTKALRVLSQAPLGGLYARSVSKAASTVLFVLLALMCARAQGNSERAMLFDDGWRFQRGGVQGAEAADFDDSVWRRLHPPNDWSAEDLARARTA